MYSIGEKIKERRAALGMTQQDLAELVGYKDRSAVNKIETGENDINQTKIVASSDISIKSYPFK